MLDGIFASNNYQAAKALLDVSAERHKIMAGNLANVDTPGFKRLDIDSRFYADLQSKIRSGNASAINGVRPRVVEEAGLAPTSPNGNNVSMDRELMLINENALKYEAMGQFVSGSLQRLKTAISGRTS